MENLHYHQYFEVYICGEREGLGSCTFVVLEPKDRLRIRTET